jgi:hypothetical protein
MGYSALGTVYHVPQFSSSSNCESTMGKWIDECNNNHHECTRQRTILPKRVLDVANGKIRLIETKRREGRYLTLSHCWGTPGTQLKTTKDTLARWELEIPESELGQTYKDAITLARVFRIDFLWIDSLCIVQGDMTEWEAESGNMASIFENSYLTICATRAEDGNGGLFSDRQLTTLRTVPFVLGNLDDGTTEAERQSITVYGRWEFEHHRGNKGGNEYSANTIEPLSRRGWAFQERLLSRRTLDFLSAEVVWQCERLQRCECTQLDRLDESSRGTDSTMFFKTALSSPETKLVKQHSSPEDSIFETNTWESVVTAYTSLKLTYPSDKLPALSGLAQRMARITTGEERTNGQYIAGLWRDALPRQLLWYMPDTGEQSQIFRAPSFSWASMDGIVQFHQIRRKATLYANVLAVHYSAKGSDPYGLCKYGELTIRAPLKRVKLVSDFAPHFGSLVSAGDPFARGGLRPLNDPSRLVGWQPDEKIDPQSVLFTDESLEFYCLLILQVKPEVVTFAQKTFYELGAEYSLVVAFDAETQTFKRLGSCCDRNFKEESVEIRTITLT